MYCDSERLAAIEKEIKGLELKAIYSDWAHGIIYMRFAHISGATKMVAIKNNYYAGMEIFKTAQEQSNEE